MLPPRIRRWLKPIYLGDNEEAAAQWEIGNTLINYLGIALLITLFVLIPLFADQKIGSWIVTATMFCGLAVGRHLIYHGRFRWGAAVIFIFIYSCILSLIILSSGSSSMAMFYFACAVLISGFFVDTRLVNGLTIPTFLIAMGLSLAQGKGLAIPQFFIFTPFFSWLAIGLGLGFMIYARDLFVGHLKNDLMRTQHKNLALQKAEETLSKSEARFRAVVEHSSNGIIFMNTERKIIYASPAYQDLIGYAPEELVGHFGIEFIHPDDLELTAQKFGEVLSTPGGLTMRDYRLRRKDGSYCWIETIVVNLLDDPFVQAVVLNQHNINERKQAEEALTLSEQSSRQAVERLRMVNQISLRITAGLDFTRLLQTIYEQCQQIGETDTFYVALYNDKTGMLSFPFYYKDQEQRDFPARNIQEIPGLSGHIIQTRQTLYFPDETALPPGINPVRQPGKPIRSLIGVPLIVNDQVVGVLSMQSHRANAYTPEHIQTLELLATQVAIAIQNSQLYEQVQSERKLADARNKQLTMLNHLGQALNSLAPFIEILESISSLIGQVIDNQNLYIALYDEARNYLSFPIYWINGEKRSSIEGRPLSNGLTEFVIRSRSPVLIPEKVHETLLERGVSLIGTICQCYLGVPILVDEKVIGVIAVQDYQRTHVFNANHVELLSTIASQAAISIKNARLYNSLQQELAERKRTEEALRKSEAMFRAVVENSNDGILFGDASANIHYRSPSYQRINGYSDEERIGRSGFETVHPDDKAGLQRYWKTLVEQTGSSGKSEYRIRHKDGTWRWIETTGQNLLSNPEVQSIVVTSRDITDRKNAEDALKLSEVKYRRMVETANEGVVVLDKDNRITLVNQQMANMLGYTIEALLGQPIESLIIEAELESHLTQVQLREQGQSTVFERRYRRKDGGKLWTLVSATPVYDAQGRFDGSFGMVADISAIKLAERALKESEARLRAIVETANDAIITMDTRGVIVDWNGAAETIFGYTNAEALGQPVNQIVPEHFRPQQQRAIERALTSNERQIMGRTIEVAGLAKDGSLVPIEMSLAEWQTISGSFFTAIIRNVSERKQRENELQSIATLSAALRTAVTRADILILITQQLVVLLNCETVSIEIIDPMTGEAVTEMAQGAWAVLIGTRQKKDTGINAIISQTRQPYYTNDLKHDPNLAYPEWTNDDIRGGIGAPLIANEQVIGFLWMGRKTVISQPEIRLLVAVADIAANAIHRVTLYERTQKDAAELARAYDTTLEGWAHALELRDQETEGHARKVVEMTVTLARRMGICEEDLDHVRRGALLHDIGKMGIPDSVLLKPGTLNEREWEIMRRHPEYAYNLLKPIEYLHPALEIPYCHHEKWDGSGYPRGLKGEEIPLTARIFAIIDVWDALNSDRSYRKAWNSQQSIQYIREQAGRHYDPRIVTEFLEMLARQKS